jgi:peptide/nickel transport system permease protein
MIWLARRLAIGIAVIWAVTTAAFVLGYVVTDPASVRLSLDVNDELRQQLRSNLGLDRPLWEQYSDFIIGLLSLNIGDSFWQHRPAFEVAIERLPRTLILTGAAYLLVLLTAPALGLYASMRAGGVVDRIATIVSMVAVSAPQFWVAYLLILVFAVQLNWLPAYGADELGSIVLPVIVLALPATGRVLLLMRSEGRSQGKQPYMSVARGRGFSSRHLLVGHTLRNVAVALTTFSAWEVTRMIAGYSVVVETVFGWPGIGLMTVSAAKQQDLILLQAGLVVTALLIVAINIGIDYLRSIIDPRIALT